MNSASANINLSIGYHNIEGSHSPTFGCKHNYIQFYNDIEIIAETWTNCADCKNAIIPNYIILDKVLHKKEIWYKERQSIGRYHNSL